MNGHYVRVRLSPQPFHERDPKPEDQSGDVSRNGKVKVWEMSGTFPESFSIAPSIDLIEADDAGNKVRTLCWHGFVTNGEAT